MVLDALSRRERAMVRAAVRRIGGPLGGKLIRSQATRLPTPEPLYLLRATPQLRVFFEKTAGAIEVLDVVRRDQLKSLARALGPRPRASESDSPPSRCGLEDQPRDNGTGDVAGDGRCP